MDVDRHNTHPLTILDTTEATCNFCEQSIQLVSRHICDNLGLSDFSLSVSFVTESTIRELNNKYRSKDSATDVLSFPQCTFEELPSIENPFKDKHLKPYEKELGDVIICLEVAKVNAEHIGQTLADEVTFLLVHSILHLCGYDHESTTDEAEMLDQQRKLVQSVKSNTKGIIEK